MKTMKEFPADFRRARKRLHLSQQEAAERIRRSVRQVHNIELHGQIPGPDAYVLACQLIGVDPMYYLEMPTEEPDQKTCKGKKKNDLIPPR